MTDIEEEKPNAINEKIMLWLGAHKHSCGYTLGREEWFHAIDFTHNIAACFRKIIPKLKRWEAGSNKDGTVWFRCNNPKGDEHGIELPIETQAKNLEMAICLAISKLIDSG